MTGRGAQKAGKASGASDVLPFRAVEKTLGNGLKVIAARQRASDQPP
jgi:hypothetical protein